MNTQYTYLMKVSVELLRDLEGSTGYESGINIDKVGEEGTTYVTIG